MIIFVCEGLTRNREIRKTPVWILPNIWRLEAVRDTTFGKDVSNDILLNAAKCNGYSLYYIWILVRENQQGVGSKITPLPHPY